MLHVTIILDKFLPAQH